ncbi:MAG TPA: hypothetical protein VLM85_11460 [Polyangiaceae bacterium]|nr:hypothetical protein [Polyangiaceae bacterium]
MSQPATAGKKYLLAWTGDQGLDGHEDPDFLAVIDATPNSPTYGHVVNTAALPCIEGANLLDQLGMLPGATSCKFNEPHHFSDPWTDPITKHKFIFAGGLISANVFSFDVTDPLHIPTAKLAVDARDLHTISGADDFLVLPNGHVAGTMMGSKSLGYPGGIVEFSPYGASTFLAEHPAAVPGGPTRFMPSINGETDAGLLAHPHSIRYRADLDVLVTTDYVTPGSIAAVNYFNDPADYGTTVRFWKASDLGAGPQKVVQVPDGPRHERNSMEEELMGLMAGEVTHKAGHKGHFTASMCGGTLYYCPDITAPNPVYYEVYDFGPGTGASLLDITDDDAFLIQPISAMASPGDPEYNRDYPGEHSRRVVVFDIRPLLAAGTNVHCGPPQVTNDSSGYTVGFTGHNNGASDCPVEVSSVHVDSPLNTSTHGGPHDVTMDKTNTYVAFQDYFVDLRNLGLPGPASVGDLKIYMSKFNKGTGQMEIDTSFRDEITGEVGVNFNRPDGYVWPGGQGTSGTAKPHDIQFIEVSDH